MSSLDYGRLTEQDENGKIIDAISSNKVCYPMSNKMWFNQRGGDIYRTIYVGKEKRYVVDKLPWNRLNTSSLGQ